MPDRRTALVDAGVELVLQQCFQDLLASVDTRSITGRAGVTTGSFFHHFRNRAAFTDAVIDRLEELWAGSTEQSLSSIATFTEGLDFHGAAAAEWRRLESDERNSGLQHLLLAVPRQPVSEGSTRTAADVLAARYRSLNEAVLPAYRRGLDAIGREVMPPFHEHDLAVALTALGAGLRARYVADAGSVRPGLYADLVSALVIAVTRPVGEQVREAETLADLDRPVAVRAGKVGPERPGSTWRQIAEAAAPLFAERMVGEVKVAEIAEVAGVSASTVYQRFGSVSAVAAAGWARHLPELEAIASKPLTTSEGPIVRMEQVLTRYIQLGRENRGALEGQVLEGVARASSGANPTSTLMPLAGLLVPHIREMRARGVLRRRIDSEGLARSVLQLIAMRVLTSPDEPEERIIDETLGMLLEGALARQVR
ncbi:MAG TPA: TetR/AcrR family transcriptional regulator [Acidimicrobiales bacterium]|nr:TetR/AcrR family transcriptional regulator [Acidimicrobiales bacterium]